MNKKLLGIDLGGTTVKFAILTLEGQVQEKWAVETNILEDGKHIVPDIVASIKHRLNLYGLTKDDFFGIFVFYYLSFRDFHKINHFR